MDYNRTCFHLDPNVEYHTLPEDKTTINTYTQLYLFDTSRHPAFVFQILNKGSSNAIHWKVETTFDKSGSAHSWTELKAEASLAADGNAVYEDVSVGTKTRVLIKAAVGDAHSTVNMWLRLKPGAYVV